MIGRYVQTIEVPKKHPLIAYRKWYRYDDDYSSLFKPVHQPHVWRDGRVEEANARPHDLNDAGFWGFKRRAEVEKHLPVDGNHTGRVLLWGRVCVHEHGYRAEFAKIPKKQPARKVRTSAKRPSAARKRK